MKDSYVFPAVFRRADDGISVEFPDLPGCLTCGKSIDEAMSMARGALSLHLYGMERDGDHIPEPSDPLRMRLGRGEFVALIDVWMPAYRDKMQRKAVNTMVTLPRWLKDLAEHENVSFSAVLQAALKQLLRVDDPPLPLSTEPSER
ncbi:MAG: type II toxin-antitoxin system HicB family antitoxin [Chloroflexota bacterium]